MLWLPTFSVPQDKVYVVSRGDYSDYRVEAIFASQELADEYCRIDGTGQFSSAEIEPRELLYEIPDYFVRLTISMRAEGLESPDWPAVANIDLVVNEHTDVYWDAPGPWAKPVEHVHRDIDKLVNFASKKPMGDNLILRVSGFDHDRVRKTFGEHADQIMARYGGASA